MAKTKLSPSAPQKAPMPKAAAPTPSAAAPSVPISLAAIPKTQAALTPRSSPQEIALHVWNKYLSDTPSRTLLLDVYLAYLVLNGVVQFVYCVIAGNYPFNAFLAGFSAAVGQFVLTASLRMQTSEKPPSTAFPPAKKTTTMTVDGVTGEVVDDLKSISSERAFADYVLASLILHLFCVNFIN